MVLMPKLKSAVSKLCFSSKSLAQNSQSQSPKDSVHNMNTINQYSSNYRLQSVSGL